MKSFFIAVAIFAVLILSGAAFNFCLNGTSKELLKSCEEINDRIDERNLLAAYDETKALSEYIDGKKPLLSSILDHGNIDEIEKEISGLLGYSEQGDATNATVCIKKLKHMFRHLPENYALTLQNIL